MKDKFFYVTIIIFLLTLAITGFLYYSFTRTSITEYDNTFVDSRNDVITQIDTLSNTLNTAEDEESINAQIQILTEKRNVLEEKFTSAKEPSKNGNEIIQANRDFLAKVDEIIVVAEEYQASFSTADVDPIEKMNSYNTKVTELNTIIENIKQIIDENSGSLF